ncbi:MAG: hypothetical protein IJF07_04815, partial [Lachnospiraceae bacterium]|nr:hypothetical protein [Lachnospiraceae bacterium]
MSIWTRLLAFLKREKKEDIIYHFTLYTPEGRVAVNSFSQIAQSLDRLYEEKKGFVRLEMNPPIEGKRYLETIYDENAEWGYFYNCILEDRPEGQGFLEYTCLKPNQKMYRYVYERHSFGLYIASYFATKKTGLQRTVMAKNSKEILYMAPYEVVSSLYDEEGRYGGDQTCLKKYARESEEGRCVRKWVRKYHPTYTSEQVDAMLQKVYAEGCGYVVVVNVLLSHFINRAAEFERKFGFPMYASNGDLNYDILLLDFYLSTDNHNLEGGVD